MIKLSIVNSDKLVERTKAGVMHMRMNPPQISLVSQCLTDRSGIPTHGNLFVWSMVVFPYIYGKTLEEAAAAEELDLFSIWSGGTSRGLSPFSSVLCSKYTLYHFNRCVIDSTSTFNDFISE